MIPSFLQKPRPTPVDDSGYATTTLPSLPFFTFDGGGAVAVSNPPIDGGNSVYAPVERTHDGGRA